MKLEEIYNTGTQVHTTTALADFNIADAQEVTHAEAPYKIIKATAFKNNRVVLYGVVDNTNQVLSSVVGEFLSLFGKMYFVIGGTWTDTEWRRKGLTTMLYTTLSKHLKVKLMSDHAQSPEMFQLWKKLQSQGVAKTISTETGEEVQIRDQDLFQDTDVQEDKYRFVIEHLQGPIPMIGEGILYSHQIYTHPSNTGLYD